MLRTGRGVRTRSVGGSCGGQAVQGVLEGGGVDRCGGQCKLEAHLEGHAQEPQIIHRQRGTPAGLQRKWPDEILPQEEDSVVRVEQ